MSLPTPNLDDLRFQHDLVDEARRMVEEALGMWEPRIKVVQVDVHPDPQETNRLLIDIQYEIKATHDRRSLVYPFYLIPEEARTR